MTPIPDDELEDAFGETRSRTARGATARSGTADRARAPLTIVHTEQKSEVSILAQGSADIVRRFGEQPIIEAGAVPGYGPIFNAGAVYHDGRFHLFARGVRDGYQSNPGPGARFLNYFSDVLVFVSDDGRSYEFQQVLAESSPGGVWCYEDPRVQVVRSRGEDQWVMSYTNLPAPEAKKVWRIGMHKLDYADGRFSLNHASACVVGPEGEPNKDAVLFNLRDGRVALIHRIYPNMQLAVFDSLDELWDPPPGYWEEHVAELDQHTILTADGGALGIGAGAPPIPTGDGLLLLFHERGGDGHYRTRAALLDDETGRVKALLPEPIMEPELPWERSGDVDNVVFIQGAILQTDGTIYATYGAADRCVGGAHLSTDRLLHALRAAA
jgi:beta-1,2-mannobiose phosphorylase / 1,2-beta-oligomannan phosphorylase